MTSIFDDPSTWPYETEEGGKARDVAGGGMEYWAKDGTRTFTLKSGETWKQVMPDGQIIEMLPDGAQRQVNADGTKIIKMRNGTVR